MNNETGMPRRAGLAGQFLAGESLVNEGLAGQALGNLDVSGRDPFAQGLSGGEREDSLAQFAFAGPVGKVLREHFNRDMAQARLTWKFRLYYHLRPWLAQGMRQALQRSRNRSLSMADDWFIPNDFILDLQAAIRPEAGEVSAEHGSRREVAELHPWPDGHRYALALTHDIEGAEGWSRVRQIAEMEESCGLRSAWYVVPHLYKIDYGLLDELRQRGHEVGIHGYNHDGRLFLSRGIFRRRVPFINAAARAMSASGFRAPMVHRNLNWMQDLEFDYDASCFDIDPFQPMPGGVGGFWPFIVGKLVELPYTLPQDHTLMVTLGQPACETWLRKLAVIKRYSGLAMLITHPDYLNSAERMDQYRQFCQQVAGDSEKWSALPREVATWWRQRQATVVGDDGQLVGPAADRGRPVLQRTLLDA